MVLSQTNAPHRIMGAEQASNQTNHQGQSRSEHQISSLFLGACTLYCEFEIRLFCKGDFSTVFIFGPIPLIDLSNFIRTLCRSKGSALPPVACSYILVACPYIFQESNKEHISRGYIIGVQSPTICAFPTPATSLFPLIPPSCMVTPNGKTANTISYGSENPSDLYFYNSQVNPSMNSNEYARGRMQEVVLSPKGTHSTELNRSKSSVDYAERMVAKSWMDVEDEIVFSMSKASKKASKNDVTGTARVVEDLPWDTCGFPRTPICGMETFH